jgi:hypothetical protein
MEGPLKFEKITDDRRRTPIMKHNLRNYILKFLKINSTKYAFRLNTRGKLVLKIVARNMTILNKILIFSSETP